MATSDKEGGDPTHNMRPHLVCIGASAGSVTALQTFFEALPMLLLEQSNGRFDRSEFQIFASDIDAGALATAREGLYPNGIKADVSQERLTRVPPGAPISTAIPGGSC